NQGELSRDIVERRPTHMLVLSRRLHERIAFPTLGVSIEIVRVDGKTVRLGIDAPRSVPVLRAELSGGSLETLPIAQLEPETAHFDHRLRGRLNAASVALFVAQKQIELGSIDAAAQTIQDALGQFASLVQELGAANPSIGSESGLCPARQLKALLV